MPQFLAPIINDQQEDSNGAPLSGGQIEVYLAGSSTAATTTSDKAGLVPNTWPIVLNTLGVNNQGAVWLTGGAAYKYIIKSSTGVVQRTIDNVSGINDTTVAADQWVVYQAAPTYVSATSFTVAGDQTQIFQPLRRVKTQNTGGLVYSTIVTSVYSSPNTTVTVRNDSGTLDSGLSQVSYGILSIQNSSTLGRLIAVRVFTTTQVYTPTPGTTAVRVFVLGGGGGGGSGAGTAAAQCASGAGGGAGGWARKFITSAFSGVTITIGTAGSAASAPSAGGNGSTTSFGALVTGNGGAGGSAGSALSNATTQPQGSGAGGLGTLGDENGLGGYGAYALYGPTPVSGKGGDSYYGSGALGVTNYATGLTATVYGAGGSGGNVTPSNAGGATSGAGAQGVCVVEEYA